MFKEYYYFCFVFQQIGDPSYYNMQIRNFMYPKCTGRWKGEHGALEWPTRSTGLNLSDFLFWGFLESKI